MRFEQLNESFSNKYGFDLQALDEADELALNNKKDICEDCVNDEDLDEGILDKIKGGVNMARSYLNNKKADRQYANGNFAAGAQARNKANELRNRADNNFANDSKNIADRATKMVQNDKNYKKMQNQASREHEKSSKQFAAKATQQFKKCKSKEELINAYKIYENEYLKSTKGRGSRSDPALKYLRNAYSAQLNALNANSQNSQNP